MATRIGLKRGSLGDTVHETAAGRSAVVRELDSAPAGARWLAFRLARREARALERLAGLEGVPRLVALDRARLVRTWLPGQAMHVAPAPSRAWFREARRLLRRMHRRGVTHNDLAKEANFICDEPATAGIVDFQLAVCFRRRGRLFRTLAREDLRHLLKHKRHYLPDALTARERALLAAPLWPTRLWRLTGKPVYRFVTRRLLGWPERDGAAERERGQRERGQSPFFANAAEAATNRRKKGSDPR